MAAPTSKGIWAIGDVTAPPWLAHKASHEGVIAAEAIAQELGNKEVHPHALDPRNIPGCTYCHPQVASVGLTEAKAKEAGHEVKVGNFPFIGNGKAIALGEAEGFIKTVFDAKTGELLGAHMIGAEVTELIQGYTIGKTARDDRGRADADRLPAPDAERDDARKRARRLRQGAAHLSGLRASSSLPSIGGRGNPTRSKDEGLNDNIETLTDAEQRFPPRALHRQAPPAGADDAPAGRGDRLRGP